MNWWDGWLRGSRPSRLAPAKPAVSLAWCRRVEGAVDRLPVWTCGRHIPVAWPSASPLPGATRSDFGWGRVPNGPHIHTPTHTQVARWHRGRIPTAHPESLAVNPPARPAQPVFSPTRFCVVTEGKMPLPPVPGAPEGTLITARHQSGCPQCWCVHFLSSRGQAALYPKHTPPRPSTTSAMNFWVFAYLGGFAKQSKYFSVFRVLQTR